MTLKPQQPQNMPSGFYSILYFWNQWLPLIKISYKIFEVENWLWRSDLGTFGQPVLLIESNCMSNKKNLEPFFEYKSDFCPQNSPTKKVTLTYVSNFLGLFIWRRAKLSLSIFTMILLRLCTFYMPKTVPKLVNATNGQQIYKVIQYIFLDIQLPKWSR